MSSVSDIIRGIRLVLTLETRVTELSDRVSALDAREMNTRERVIRIEGMIDGARYLPGPQRPLLQQE